MVRAGPDLYVATKLTSRKPLGYTTCRISLDLEIVPHFGIHLPTIWGRLQDSTGKGAINTNHKGVINTSHLPF